MLGAAKEMYISMLQDRRFAGIPLESLQRSFLRAGAEELGLPPVALALFIEVKGYDRSPHALHTIWASIVRNCRNEAGWISVEEAQLGGAWAAVKRSAGQAPDF